MQLDDVNCLPYPRQPPSIVRRKFSPGEKENPPGLKLLQHQHVEQHRDCGPGAKLYERRPALFLLSELI
jgi:hypothetical protein